MGFSPEHALTGVLRASALEPVAVGAALGPLRRGFVDVGSLHHPRLHCVSAPCVT